MIPLTVNRLGQRLTQLGLPAIILSLLGQVGQSQEAVPGDSSHSAALVRIELPLPGGDAEIVKARVTRAIERLTDANSGERGSRPTLVVELIPGATSKFGEECSFESALSLARYFTSRSASLVRTIAYIPQSLQGHGLLIAFACEQIYVAPDAEFGEAGIAEQGRRVDPSIVDFYRHIAQSKGTMPAAVVLGLLDPELAVVYAETEGTPRFVVQEELENLRKEHDLVDEKVIIRPGVMGRFTGREAWELGLISSLAADRDALAAALKVPATALVEEQAVLGAWRPVMLELDGEITLRTARQIANLVGEQRDKRNVNWIGVRITSRGGDIQACLDLAETFARQVPSEVRTVAYIPVEAVGGAALIAMSCDQIVMHDSARLGGNDFPPIEEDILSQATETIRNSLADRTHHSWSLLAATIDPHVEVFPFRHRETGAMEYMSLVEHEQRQDADLWSKAGDAITEPEGYIDLTAEEAKSLGVTWQVARNSDDLQQIYGFDVEPETVRPNWALELVEALSAPGFAILLIFIGIVGIYIELQAPGVGLGGFCASVAFMLFFWSKFLHGTAGWLEAILLVGGVVFVLIEVLVLPGLGIFGVGGGLMIVASLVLASQTFVLPHSGTEMDQLRDSLMVVTAAGFGALCAALLLRRYLPHTPIFNRIMLVPPEGADQVDLDHRETVVDYSDLVGKAGVASTALRPTGRAEFDGEPVDVIAESGFIEAGESVEIVEARANRVLVRLAGSAGRSTIARN